MASMSPKMDVSLLLILVMIFHVATSESTTTGEVVTSPYKPPAMKHASDVTMASADSLPTKATSSQTGPHDRTMTNMTIYKSNKLSTTYIHKVYADPDGLSSINCHLRPDIHHLDQEIKQLSLMETKLIELTFNVVNHSSNPLLQNTTWVYKGNMWTHIRHSHGQTILNLAFNYGVLSLMTLNFGVARLDIPLIEQPFGCLEPLNETEKFRLMLELLLQNFTLDGKNDMSVCHQMIRNANGYAKFTDRCCFNRSTTGEIVCTIDLPNQWLNGLDLMVNLTAVIFFLWGPMAIMSLFHWQTLDIVRYEVNLKEPLYKTISVFCGQRPHHIFTNHEIDLRHDKDFVHARAICQKLPENKVISIKISEFNILVNYNSLLPENEVPVGVFKCLSKAIFFCKIREVDVFADCCESNLFGACHEEERYPWINICRVIGRLLLVLAMPLPFYIRLAVFYIFEHPEVMDRTAAAAQYGLPMWFEYRMLQYFTPLHPLLITIYLIYFSIGFTVAIMSDSARKNIFKTMITDTLKDLSSLSWLSALQMVVSNFIWPFKKMGLFGFFFGLIYWPIVMPLSILACCFYCTPLIFACCRLVTHALRIASKDRERKDRELPGELKLMPTGMQAMEADKLPDWISFSGMGENRLKASIKRHGLLRLIFNFLLACVAIATLVSIMIVFTECVTFLLQICVFTMMGIIVNAGRVLKYGTLIFLVVLYSYDCYNNVYKDYLKLNLAIFSEIKSRIKDIMDVTSLPSHLQKNMGFKSAEASEQNEYETTDDLSKEDKKHWVINDLILFIDNIDVPRIPELLFEKVCGIQVPGSPGPVHLSLLAATGKFLFIIIFLIFVFIVVLSFGTVYQMSATNTMLATLAGGFMPMIFRNVLKPASPDIDLNSLSFKSKLEEVVINFWQVWPMYDFPFDLEEKPEEDEDSGSDSYSDDKADKKDKDKKDKDKNGKDKKEKKEKKDHRDSLASFGMLGDELFVDEAQIEEKLSEMKGVRPADGQYVDIVILLPQDCEWDPEISSSYEHEAELLKPTININITSPDGATIHDV